MVTKKRATIFAVTVPILVMLALAFFYVNFSYNEQDKPKDFGDSRMDTLETFIQAEKAMIYIDLSAEYSAYKTAHNIAENSEDKYGLGCGQIDGYAIWRTKEKDCFPGKKTIFKKFSQEFNKQISKYLSNYEDTSFENEEEIIIPKNNYDILFDDEHLVGIATKNLKIRKENINYSLKPSFNVDVNQNFIEDYDHIIEKAIEINKTCSGIEDEEESITTCINLILEEDVYDWSFEESGDFFVFSAESKEEIPFYDSKTEKISKKPLKYKFALSLKKEIEQEQN